MFNLQAFDPRVWKLVWDCLVTKLDVQHILHRELACFWLCESLDSLLPISRWITDSCMQVACKLAVRKAELTKRGKIRSEWNSHPWPCDTNFNVLKTFPCNSSIWCFIYSVDAVHVHASSPRNQHWQHYLYTVVLVPQFKGSCTGITEIMSYLNPMQPYTIIKLLYYFCN